jgi:CRISPR-associated protein Cmr1
MDRLASLDLDLEAVTPLWIGGAGRNAELRPPSVRGCMRFWFRALAGGLLGDVLPDIRQAEAAVFGDTSRASSVAVRMTGTPQTSSSVVAKEHLLPGLNYMFWSVFQQGRDAILPGERFRLRLQSRPFPFPAVQVRGRKLEKGDWFELAEAALWLLLRVGGVGCRTRRAAGGMRAVAEPQGWPAGLPPLVSTAVTPAALAGELAEGIQRIRQLAQWQAPFSAGPSSFDILHESVCQLYLVDTPFASWWEAVNWAGEKFLAFRRDQRDDATGVAGLLTRGRLAVRTITRAVLGLPITFFFKSIFADLASRGIDSREARRKASATVSPSRGLARTSPLFFRILRLAGDPPTYAVLMGLFRSRLLPDLEMTVRPNDYSIKPARVDVPADFSLLDKWFAFVQGQGARLVPVSIQGPEKGTGLLV